MEKRGQPCEPIGAAGGTTEGTTGPDAAQSAPLCRARYRGTKTPCRNPAVDGRPTCQIHGGTGGAPEGERNGAWKHGMYSKAELAERRERMETLRNLKALIAMMRDKMADRGQ